MKILALSDCLLQSHTFWIRVGQYLETISKNIQITFSDDPSYLDFLEKNDKLILYRYNEDWGDIREKLRQLSNKGVQIISDVDDYLWFDSIFRGWTERRLRYYTLALKECDILTCSTYHLCEQMSIMFKKQKIFLVTNSAPFLRGKMQKRPANKIRVGWTGAPWTRPQDLKIIKSLVQWMINNDHKIQIVHIGSVESLPSMAGILDIPEHFIEKKPLQSHNKYLQSIDFDIGLAPLANTCFNQFKSPIKVIEYSNFEIPWIASQVPIYEKLCEQWNWKGRLCKTEKDWIDELIPLLNATKRKNEGNTLSRLCQRYSSFQAGIDTWKLILEIN